MLTLTPRAWVDQIPSGNFELGITPKKDENAFYAGIGLVAKKFFSFGMGFTWQQTTVVGKGLSVGQQITDPALLKTDTRFKGGAYLHLTIVH